MERTRLHVTPFAEGWRVTTDDGRRVSELFLERTEAVRRAEGLARIEGEATVIVHGRGDLDGDRHEFRSETNGRG
jgi:hypothetical protein